ncbi:hypothetical protein [Streptomyces sp. IBSBF 3136]|uniref:hypothetical protein n=1 Tax=Streptomyces sp. IBSBF 3136 TaxID=2903524 RepID=UPI002FDBD929
MLDLVFFQMMARVLLAVGAPEPETVFSVLGKVGRWSLEKAAAAAIQRATETAVERRLSRRAQPENADTQ